MAVPARTQLGAPTTNKKWFLDVDSTPNGPSSTWLPVRGITNFVPVTDDGGFEDDTDFDGQGAKSQAKTLTGFSATSTVARKVDDDDSTQYDEGQEFLRAAFEQNTGVQAVAHVRFYEMEPGGPRVQAYEGWVAGSWAEQGGTVGGLSSAMVTMNGRGAVNSIDHPDTAAAAVAVLHSVTPTSLDAAGGELVLIKGTSFVGATDVKFGATAAAAYTVIDDATISAITPAHAAGSVAVAVTNGVGPSTVNVTVTFA